MDTDSHPTQSALPAQGQYDLLAEGTPQVAFRIDAPVSEGLILGRSDGGSPYVPDIDLTECDAREYGVSRRHAALVRYRDGIHILDLGSVNGTFVNGKRLRPDTPVPVCEGDRLTLGTLNISLSKIN